MRSLSFRPASVNGPVAGSVRFSGKQEPPEPLDPPPLWGKKETELIPAGNEEAAELFSLGKSYALGINGTPRNGEQAGLHFYRAALLGDAKVKLMAGRTLASGLGDMPPYPDAALHVLALAYHQGDDAVKLDVARIHAEGIDPAILARPKLAILILDRLAFSTDDHIREQVVAIYQNGLGSVGTNLFKALLIKYVRNENWLSKFIKP